MYENYYKRRIFQNHNTIWEIKLTVKKVSNLGIKNRKKLCYIKYGNVCEELEHSKASDIITGGHYSYVYTTSHVLQESTDILYLSTNKKKGLVRFNSCIAKNINPIVVKGIFKKPIKILHSILRIIVELFKYQPDHILCVRTHGLLLYYLYARINMIPFTMSIHTDLEVGKKWARKIEHSVLKNSNSIICHGPYLSKQVKKIAGPSKKTVEYNASNWDIIQARKDQLKTSDKLNCFGQDSRIISYIGRLETNKGTIDLYNAFKQLKDKTNYELCFAGSGIASPLLKRMIIKDHLKTKVHLLGEINRNEVAELLGKTWVAVSPTRKELSEGRCMAAIEALSSGVPLIAPEFGAFKYLVKNGTNGLFYEPNSINDITNKLKLMQHPEIRNKLAKGAAIDNNRFSTNLISYGEAVKICLEMD